MKNIISLMFLIFITIGCQGKSRDQDMAVKDSLTVKSDTLAIKKDNEINNNFNNDTTMEQNLERFDYKVAEQYTPGNSVEIKMGDTIRAYFPYINDIRGYIDYLPASDLYTVAKNFYSNGVIKNKVNMFSMVRFGIYEEYDENGYCIKKVDEDRKFGKIKREDVIIFLEKKGWFNRKTGENKIVKESPLKTDGTFTRSLMWYISIGFIEAKYDTSGKETEPPKWYIRIKPYNTIHVTEYELNGNTGAYQKKEYNEYKLQ